MNRSDHLEAAGGRGLVFCQALGLGEVEVEEGGLGPLIHDGLPSDGVNDRDMPGCVWIEMRRHGSAALWNDCLNPLPSRSHAAACAAAPSVCSCWRRSWQRTQQRARTGLSWMASRGPAPRPRRCRGGSASTSL